MKYFVYIIYSEKLDRYYVGTTDDVQKRILEHNSMKYAKSFTTKGIPWVLKLSYACEDSAIAYALEKFIKRMKSKLFLEKIICNPKILDSIVQEKL